MRFQKNVINKWDNKFNKLSKLDQLIIRSNLLGGDLKVTNFGGGNTSSKISVKDPITKKNEKILYVKGSGGDLGSIRKDGFASLYLDKFNSLKNSNIIFLIFQSADCNKFKKRFFFFSI